MFWHLSLHLHTQGLYSNTQGTAAVKSTCDVLNKSVVTHQSLRHRGEEMRFHIAQLEGLWYRTIDWRVFNFQQLIFILVSKSLIKLVILIFQIWSILVKNHFRSSWLSGICTVYNSKSASILNPSGLFWSNYVYHISTIYTLPTLLETSLHLNIRAISQTGYSNTFQTCQIFRPGVSNLIHQARLESCVAPVWLDGNLALTPSLCR